MDADTGFSRHFKQSLEQAEQQVQRRLNMPSASHTPCQKVDTKDDLPDPQTQMMRQYFNGLDGTRRRRLTGKHEPKKPSRAFFSTRRSACPCSAKSTPCSASTSRSTTLWTRFTGGCRGEICLSYFITVTKVWLNNRCMCPCSIGSVLNNTEGDGSSGDASKGLCGREAALCSGLEGQKGTSDVWRSRKLAEIESTLATMQER